MTASSPSSSSAWQALNSACLAPEVATICPAGQRRPTCACIQSEMASRNSTVPLGAVYLVCPLRSASPMAASTCGKTGKSGSPTESETMSRPSRRSWMARAVIAMVAEAFTAASRRDVT